MKLASPPIDDPACVSFFSFSFGRSMCSCVCMYVCTVLAAVVVRERGSTYIHSMEHRSRMHFVCWYGLIDLMHICIMQQHGEEGEALGLQRRRDDDTYVCGACTLGSSAPTCVEGGHAAMPARCLAAMAPPSSNPFPAVDRSHLLQLSLSRRPDRPVFLLG